MTPRTIMLSVLLSAGVVLSGASQGLAEEETSSEPLQQTSQLFHSGYGWTNSNPSERPIALEPAQHGQDDADTAAPVQPIHVVWIPGAEWNDDSAGRERWTLSQQLKARLTRFGHLVVRHERSHFRSKGSEPVSDDAVGVGWQQALGRSHVLLGEAVSHMFSAPGETLWAWSAKARSNWSPRFRTAVEVGRKPADTAQALAADISTELLDATARWESASGWSAQLRGRLEQISDDNHGSFTEFEAGRKVPGVQGLRGVYVWTTQNTSERRDAYWTPHRLKLHQVGADLAMSGPRWWLWGRYLFGFGEELGANDWDVHNADLTFSMPFLGPTTLEPGFSWSKSPTYHSVTYRLLAHCEF